MRNILKAIYYAIFHNNAFRGFGKVGKFCKIYKALAKRNPKDIVIGSNVKILSGWRIECFHEYGGQKYEPHFEIGDYSQCGYRFSCFVVCDCIIGKNVAIASDVLITTENHGIDPEGLPYIDQPLSSGPVTIGDNAWIGEKVTILPNVTIGERSIIGANSVVTHDIPPYSIAVGAPAKVIKRYNFETKKWEKA